MAEAGRAPYPYVMALAAILFDLDGVLIESQDAWFHLLTAAAGDLGHPRMPRAVFDASFGQGIEADAEQFFGGIEPAKLEAYFDAHFLDHSGHVRVDPDAAPLLSALADRGLARAIVTNTTTPLAKEVIRRLGLAPDLLVGASDVARPKPAPDAVQLACERLGIAPAEAWMVGDSRFDREAAQDAGVTFIGYRIDGDRRIDRLAQLLRLVDDGGAVAAGVLPEPAVR